MVAREQLLGYFGDPRAGAKLLGVTQGDDAVKQLSTMESRCRRTRRVTLQKMSGSRGFKICSWFFFHPYILGEDEPNFDVRIFFSDGLVQPPTRYVTPWKINMGPH